MVNKILDLKNAQPRIIWTVECYHYATKTRIVPHVDSDENISDREESLKKMSQLTQSIR